ncbi:MULTISPECIES: (Fe-S)-binding protein [unclassified Clostridium]|uniref:(Fe-S)-binding protein n=1 Tax=unclassified Clostridium TaxID=2614128 RepID=UPI001106ED96|nr:MULTISPECIES: (Fe-S)-binding protein [unclassified Clostridium]
MDGMFRMKDSDKCIHCRICRKNCSFLSKYGLDIGDTSELKKLAYHCFLCGTCTQVCPVGIDGRSVILEMRRERVEENQGKCPEKGYSMLLAEKRNYIYRNKRRLAGRSILFPGCNFPSFYPKTTRKLISLLEEKEGMGVLFDCCGKPVAELGLQRDEDKIVRRINENLRRAGALEAVMLCPNCYDFLKDKLEVRVISIYEKLSRLGIGRQVEENGVLFLPCPDRERRQWVEWLSPFLKNAPETVRDVQCCGLGGCAGVREPDLAGDMAGRMAAQGHEHIFTYCASCAGNLTRSGCQGVMHLLPEILECDEGPDIRKSMVNRMMTKFW